MASRYDGRRDAPTITRRRHVLACARCRARRVKCDRAQPACSNCIKVGALCQPVQQTSSSGASTTSRPGSREPVERSQLTKLEEEVARLSREVDSRSPSREPSYSPPPIEIGTNRFSANSGKLVDGRTPGYLSPYSWAVAAGEMLPFEPTGNQAAPEVLIEESIGSATEETLRMIDDQLHEILLETFSHRVDPIVRVLHWPSLQEKGSIFRQRRRSQMHMPVGAAYTGAYVQDPHYSAQQISPFTGSTIPTIQGPNLSGDKQSNTSFDRAFATLLCTVYYASIISIIHGPNPSDHSQSFNAVVLWSSLRRELTSRLNIMDESFVQAASMELLQAMVLYLSVELGTVNPQRQWLQLGTTIHMAQSLGVHRDPSTFGLGPVEIETRRRLWAQICILDSRLAEQLCREPAINPDTFDISLPLSIADQNLTELDIHSRSANQDSEMDLTRFQEVEDFQEHAFPFSPMALLIVEAETARQQQLLLCLRYNPRDRPFRTSSTSPIAKRAIPFSGRTDRMLWANELQARLSARYNWDNYDNSDPLQYLVSEICQINLLKIKIMGSMTQREEMSATSQYGHSKILRQVSTRLSQTALNAFLDGATKDSSADRNSTFHDALHLASRCARLLHQYSNSPYNWYTRRVRDVYSCSFLAIALSSDQQLSVEDTSAAWSVLDQLFPEDTTQRPMEPGMLETLLEKTVTKARMKKELRLHIPVGTHLGEHAMQASAEEYPANAAPQPPATSPANFGQRSAFQTTGNIFEDWDALLQEQIWPGNLPGDNNYWV
ncbi:hypothetical protein PMIN04_010229 [Paraphaeosphaeria minitans]|uniref:Fungal specific transcription factor domain-containing protein (C6 zinc finger protein) n=1 Tax=Paraphaeosphaeria minitans TaxID=565426 RepID=A0A9P6G8T3_9PLEO|nr:fungal specific transcription factor domain-containing protein (C6 zinc finger protein) [Paraphaeosphaeria minitans]